MLRKISDRERPGDEEGEDEPAQVDMDLKSQELEERKASSEHIAAGPSTRVGLF
jgi:hypothetical protein